mmetsp:Transcript_1805/g.11037  ORF Transcript_1805/g.11037 Transcript_1805/m.11037 type:complete len:292 (-) Transcript_1805:721-1596(-)
MLLGTRETSWLDLHISFLLMLSFCWAMGSLGYDKALVNLCVHLSYNLLGCILACTNGTVEKSSPALCTFGTGPINASARLGHCITEARPYPWGHESGVAATNPLVARPVHNVKGLRGQCFIANVAGQVRQDNLLLLICTELLPFQVAFANHKSCDDALAAPWIGAVSKKLRPFAIAHSDSGKSFLAPERSGIRDEELSKCAHWVPLGKLQTGRRQRRFIDYPACLQGRHGHHAVLGLVRLLRGGHNHTFVILADLHCGLVRSHFVIQFSNDLGRNLAAAIVKQFCFWIFCL